MKDSIMGKKVLYCGIDLSFTGTGIVIIDEANKVLNKVLISTKTDKITEDRIIFIYNSFRTFRKDTLNSLTSAKRYPSGFRIKYGIEGIAFGSRGQRAFQQGALHYYFRIRLRKKSPAIVPPSQLKRFVTGNGRATKSLMLLQIYKRFGEEFNDDNLGDAYSLARYIKDERNVLSLASA